MQKGWIILVAVSCAPEPRSASLPEAPVVPPSPAKSGSPAAETSAPVAVSQSPLALSPAGAAEAVAHLAGCWEATGDPADTWLVQYTHPIGGLVIGTTRQFRGGALIFDEVERFSVGPDGTFGMSPIAEGVPRARFVLDVAQSGPGKAVFVNPANDWPKAIRYARTGDRLEVVAEGGDQALGLALRPAGCR